MKTKQAEFKERMDYNELLNCTRCGFCQPTCPTFVETGSKEASSPRGRIALMKAVVDGKLVPDQDFERELDLCLGCRACETACPSGVRYGHLLEEARAIVSEHKKYSFPVKLFRNFVFKQLFPKRKRLLFLGSLLAFYQRSGLQRIVRWSKILKLLPGNASEMESVLPVLTSKERLSKGHEVKSFEGKEKVGFFHGCIMDVLFFDTNENTIHLLELAGKAVSVPDNQTCCGALHAHAGEKELAKELAKQNIEQFERAKVEYIVTNAGGCGSFLVDYENLLKDDPMWHERAIHFSSKVKDISEFLIERGYLPELEKNGDKVTYQDSCHLKHGMGVSDAPRELIKKINGTEYVELKDAGMCCGSAGIYNLLETEMSMKILDHKMENVMKTEAMTVVTTNPGCLLQMQLGIKRAGLEQKVKAVHLVDLVYESIQDSKST